MKKFDDGGPVYPGYEITSGDGKGGWTKVNEHPGITRRNECADRIAAAYVSNSTKDFLDDDLIAKRSYQITDALIAYGKKE